MTDPKREMPEWAHLIVFLFREIGIAGCLIFMVCYQYFFTLPSVQDDFRAQTNKLVDAVSNNSEVMGKVVQQLENNTKVLNELVNRIERPGQ